MSETVDRRTFLKYAGAAGGATGAAWVAPSVLGTSSAFAAGSQSRCADSQTLHWTDYLPGGSREPSVGGTITFALKVNAVGANPDVWVKVTVAAFSSTLRANGTSTTAQFPGKGDNNSTSPNPTAGGINNFNVTGDHLFNGYDSYYQLCMKCNTQAGYTVAFAFYSDAALTTPIDVFNLQFKLIDIDRQSTGNNYNDKMYLNPGTGFTSTKGVKVSGAGTASVPWVGNTQGVTNDDGTVAVTYAGPLNQFMFTYQATEYTSNFNQYIAIGDLSWC